MKEDNTGKNKLGMVGLGTMGRNLLLNMADSGFKVAGYDKNEDQVKQLKDYKNVTGFTNLQEFVDSLSSPKAIMLLVPAGKIVDLVIEELKPLLQKGDIIIDGGNSKFTDTDRRDQALEKDGIRFFGMGVSGGEEGARKGPSMMPGGHKDSYKFVQPIFEAIAAKVNGEPCVTYIGPGSSGNYVKMVHNGIEYAIMQLLAETYDVLRNGIDFTNDQIHETFSNWNEGRLGSFLMETSRDIFAYKNPENNEYLIDLIKDEAKSKGTGKWTSQFGMDINLPIPSLDVSVSTRDLSKYKAIRTQLGVNDKKIKLETSKEDFVKELEKAFYFTSVCVYSQGMHLLNRASDEYNWNLQLDQIAKIWRGGCIIRSKFLENIYQAFSSSSKIEHMFQDEAIATILKENKEATKNIIIQGLMADYSLPVLTSSLSYYNAMHDARMPTNLIQAQRDYFGAHTYELVGKEGVYHTKWTSAYEPSIKK